MPNLNLHLFRLFRNFSSIPPSKIRNIGIIAHIDAGKTTTTERILFHSGFTRSIGSVDQGNTVTDYLEMERQRGITIQSACIPLGWKDHKINLIDTPGHVDFYMEVERCIRVLDGCVVILDAVAGVEAQTETVWKQASQGSLPRLLFVNKMDRDGACLSYCVSEIRKRLTGAGDPIVIHWPLVRNESPVKGTGGPDFHGVVDLLSMEKVIFTGTGGMNVVREALGRQDQKLWDVCIKARRELVEQVSDVDDVLLDRLLQLEDPDLVDCNLLKEAIRRGTIANQLVPVLVGASFRNIGVQLVMDAIVDYLPSPLDRPNAVASVAVNGIVTPDKVGIGMQDPKMFALAFKVIHDPNKGPLVFVRVYSGVLEARSILLNTTQRCVKERATKVLQMYADDYQEIPRLEAGNIGAIQGLAVTKTGDTLATPYGQSPKKSLQLLPINIPPPVFFCSIEASSVSEEKKLDAAIQSLIRQDPSLSISVDEETKQKLLGGMGELHLQVSLARLQEMHRIDVKMGKVMIAYRESILSEDDSMSTFKYERQVLGKRIQAFITLSVSQVEQVQDLEDIGREGIKNTNRLIVDREPVDAACENTALDPSLAFEAIVQGIKDALSRGPFLGFPVANVKIHVSSVQFSQDSCSISTLQVAAFKAVSDLIFKKAEVDRDVFGRNGLLLEPIMRVEISTPQRFVGAVVRDLGGVRRGHVLSLDSSNDQELDHESRVVHARIPLSSLIGYSSSLRSLTQGNGFFSMELSGFSNVHGDKQRDVIKECRGYI